MQRVEQQAAYEPAELAVDRLPRWKIVGQQPLAAAAARQIAQIGRRLAPAPGYLGQERHDERPLLVSQIGGLTLGGALKSSHPATALRGPHRMGEAHPGYSFNPFPNGL